MWWKIRAYVTRQMLPDFARYPTTLDGRTLSFALSDGTLQVFLDAELSFGPTTFRIRAPNISSPGVSKYITSRTDAPSMSRDAARLLSTLLARADVEGVHVDGGNVFVDLTLDATPTRLLMDQAFAFLRRVEGAFLVEGQSVQPCPVCPDAMMDEKAGSLLESICPVCRGHFVNADVAREYVYGPRGITPGDLKDEDGSGAATCTTCARAMNPVLIDDDIVDVCRGCGALWLDAGELARVTDGRIKG